MALAEQTFLPDDAATRSLGASFAGRWKTGDLILLEGPLGAGKTTFVRGLLGALGWSEPVRSPTFNILQVFSTEPPVMHADLYRLRSAQGLGIEDYLDAYLCLIEWPDRAADLDLEGAWQVRFELLPQGRNVYVTGPGPSSDPL